MARPLGGHADDQPLLRDYYLDVLQDHGTHISMLLRPGGSANIRIDAGEVIEGGTPRHQLRFGRAWAELIGRN